MRSQTNYMLTCFAVHTERFSHDVANRYPQGEGITAQMVWENVCGQVKPSAHGYLLFDDTVLDHNHSFEIELVRRQYSGNAHGTIKGIGVGTCVYVNREKDRFWIIDYRIYDPYRVCHAGLDSFQTSRR